MVIKPETDTGKKTYSACIAVFGEPQLLYARDEYQVYEQYDPHVFDHTDLSDVIMRFDKHIAASTKKNTLRFYHNEKGLFMQAVLDRKYYDKILNGYIMLIEYEVQDEQKEVYSADHIDIFRIITDVRKAYCITVIPNYDDEPMLEYSTEQTGNRLIAER